MICRHTVVVRIRGVILAALAPLVILAALAPIHRRVANLPALTLLISVRSCLAEGIRHVMAKSHSLLIRFAALSTSLSGFALAVPQYTHVAAQETSVWVVDDTTANDGCLLDGKPCPTDYQPQVIYVHRISASEAESAHRNYIDANANPIGSVGLSNFIASESRRFSTSMERLAALYHPVQPLSCTHVFHTEAWQVNMWRY